MYVLKTSTYAQNAKHETRRRKNAVAVAHNKPWKNTPYISVPVFQLREQCIQIIHFKESGSKHGKTDGLPQYSTGGNLV
jgi:hypothetical protein